MEKDNKNVALIAIVVVVIIGLVGGVALLSNNSNTDSSKTVIANSSSSLNSSMQKSSNIVETASNTPILSTLVVAVKSADLVTALSDPNANYTVFAPDNAAFAKIQSTVDSLLLPENKTKLQDILKYHVVNTKVLSSELKDGQVINTLKGDTLKVKLVNGEVFINNSKVIKADISTSNGVVHVIDSVLIP